MKVRYQIEGNPQMFELAYPTDPTPRSVELTVTKLDPGNYTFWLIVSNAATTDPHVTKTAKAPVVFVARPTIDSFTARALDGNKVKLVWKLGGGQTTSLKVFYISSKGPVSLPPRFHQETAAATYSPTWSWARPNSRCSPRTTPRPREKS